MSAHRLVPLEKLIASRGGLVDPAKHPDECFDLYSIPAFDRRLPDVVYGAEIGSAKQLVQPGDVLLSKIVPHIRRAWVVGCSRGRRIIASGEWIVFRSGSIDPNFIRHLLVSDDFHSKFMRTVSGVGGSLLRARPEHVSKICVTLVPLEEQRRIAKILDKAEALRTKRRAALVQLNDLAQSIFLDMFGDPVRNPKWPVETLGSVVDTLQYGPRFYNEAYSKDGIRIVRITDLKEDGSLDFDAMPRLAISEQELPKSLLKPGDVIFARTGATVGKTAVVRQSDPPCIAGAYFIVMRFEDRITPVYARGVLSSTSVRQIIARRSRQAAQQNFSGPGLRQLPMPVPPLSLQRVYAARLDAVDKVAADLESSQNHMDALFASLQHRAFRGEL